MPMRRSPASIVPFGLDHSGPTKRKKNRREASTLGKSGNRKVAANPLVFRLI